MVRLAAAAGPTIAVPAVRATSAARIAFFIVRSSRFPCIFPCCQWFETRVASKGSVRPAQPRIGAAARRVDRGGYDRPRRLRTMELSSGKFIAMSDGGIDKAQA